MRKWETCGAVAMMALACSAQGNPDPVHELAYSAKPLVSVVVHPGSGTSSLVEITMLNGDYPADLLKKQCLQVGDAAGSALRGLYVYATPSAASGAGFIKAQFGIDGISDSASGVYRIEPFAKAFAGAPSPNTINAMMIQFEGAQPTAKTVHSYGSAAVAVWAEALVPPEPKGLEFRVRLLKQDPNSIQIPDHFVAKEKTAKPMTPQNHLSPWFWVLAAGGLASLGCLVYFTVLATQRNAARPNRPRPRS